MSSETIMFTFLFTIPFHWLLIATPPIISTTPNTDPQPLYVSWNNVHPTTESNNRLVPKRHPPNEKATENNFPWLLTNENYCS